MCNNINDDYSDIIDLERPPKEHSMPAIKRAAQFAPFDALTGLSEQIKETFRLTEEFRVPDEEQKAKINAGLNMLLEGPRRVRLVFFVRDKKKEGGEYVRFSGMLRHIDESSRVLHFTDGTAVSFDALFDIEVEE